MASFLQILCAAFGHCADFRGGCFNLQRFPVRPNSAKIRAEHHCPARLGRDNLFRGLLFCDCCGHPLTLSRKKLKDRVIGIYPCFRYNRFIICNFKNVYFENDRLFFSFSTCDGSISLPPMSTCHVLQLIHVFLLPYPS